MHGLDEDLFEIWVDCHPRTQQMLRREIVTGERDPATLTQVVILRLDNIVKHRMQGVAELLGQDDRRGREEAESQAKEFDRLRDQEHQSRVAAEEAYEAKQQELAEHRAAEPEKIKRAVFDTRSRGGKESAITRGENANWRKEKVWQIAEEIEHDQPNKIGTDRPLARAVIEQYHALINDTTDNQGEPKTIHCDLNYSTVRDYLRERRKIS